MESIVVFAGDNAFAIREEARRWVRTFAERYGEDNILRRDGTKLSLPDILDDVAVAPFLAERRLVVLEGLPALKKPQWEALVQNMHAQTVLLLLHVATGARRKPLPRDWPAGISVQTFAALKGRQVGPWMQEEARRNGVTLAPAAQRLLQSLIGDDQGLLSSELAKLALASAGGTITEDDVVRLGVPSSDAVVWKLTDDLCAGRRHDALRYAQTIQQRGGDAYGVWAVLLTMFRNLTVVAAALHSGSSQSTIAQRFGLHPFAVRSIAAYAGRVDLAALETFLATVVEADIGLKTGIYRATDEAPEELCALIDRSILTCP